MSPSRHPDLGAHDQSVEGQPTPMSLPSTDSYLPAEEASPPILGLLLLCGIAYFLGIATAWLWLT